MAESIIFSDSFTRSDSALGGVGNSWVDPTSSWQISSNSALAVSSDFTTKYLRRPDGETPDVCRIDVDANHITDVSVLVCLRLDAASKNGYVAWLGSSFLSIAIMTAGNPIYESDPHGVLSGSNYRLSMVANGRYIVAELRDLSNVRISRVCREDTTYTSGEAGVSSLINGNLIDNFEVSTDLSPSNYLIGDGDSITSGGTNGFDNGANGWVGYCLHDLGLSWRASQNFGVGGQTLADMLTDFSSQIAPAIAAAPYPVTYIIAGGSNDAYFNASPATIQSRWTLLISAALSAGASKVGVATIIRRDNFPGSSTIPGDEATQLATFNSNLDTANAWLRANAESLGVFVVDWDGDVRFSNPRDGIYISSDFVHPTIKGAGALGEITATSILAQYITVSSGDIVGYALQSNAIKLGTATVNTSGKKFKKYSGRSLSNPDGELPTQREIKLSGRFDDKSFYGFNK